MQLFKVSHHGSRNNISTELLELVQPEQVLVCTDGSKYRHPDADALDLLRKHYPGVPIHFTDDTALIQERAHAIGARTPDSLPLVIDIPIAAGTDTAAPARNGAEHA